MLHIPNSAEGNCLTEKENHTLCLTSKTSSVAVIELSGEVVH